ncbi:MAG: hypothetical protein ACKOWG_15815, partial [Planctomycetia bacterium]
MPFPRLVSRRFPLAADGLTFRILPARIAALLMMVFAGAMLAVASAVAEPPARGPSVNPSAKEIRELLDQAEELRKEGKPAKAAARLAEAAQGIEELANGGASPSGLRSLWERCRSLRDDLELEDVDVSGIVLAPLKSAGKPSGKNPAGAAPKPAPGNAKPAVGVRPGAAAAAGKPAAKPALTFSAQVAPILSRHCGGCHIAGRKGGFQMVSYAGLMKSGVVQPGVGESSRLVEVILSGDMPRGGGKVSPEEIGLRRQKIEPGALVDPLDEQADLVGRHLAAPTGHVAAEDHLHEPARLADARLDDPRLHQARVRHHL